ncbi:MAG: hypothetical protein KF871_12490 [Hydrogenophaga sp.]|uniref:hypothetical protein n=1 Tax=Hydrogenophaga sp. TaxID=1904254 RepID=UPI001D32BB9B|nr:hypothetical protein [Hydrogenophaga sp.]MBX3610704.1 hypothetical protein [Hydrogenophaga sp.]
MASNLNSQLSHIASKMRTAVSPHKENAKSAASLSASTGLAPPNGHFDEQDAKGANSGKVLLWRRPDDKSKIIKYKSNWVGRKLRGLSHGKHEKSGMAAKFAFATKLVRGLKGPKKQAAEWLVNSFDARPNNNGVRYKVSLTNELRACVAILAGEQTSITTDFLRSGAPEPAPALSVPEPNVEVLLKPQTVEAPQLIELTSESETEAEATRAPGTTSGSDDVSDTRKEVLASSVRAEAVKPSEMSEAQRSGVREIMWDFAHTVNQAPAGAGGHVSFVGVVQVTEAAKKAGEEMAALFKGVAAKQEGAPNTTKTEREALKQNVIRYLEKNLVGGSAMGTYRVTKDSQEGHFLQALIDSFSKALDRA